MDSKKKKKIRMDQKATLVPKLMPIYHFDLFKLKMLYEVDLSTLSYALDPENVSRSLTSENIVYF